MNKVFTAFAHARSSLMRLGFVLLLGATVFGAIEIARIYLESDYRETLKTEAKRRAIEITALTMNGNVMGTVATMGLIVRPLKNDARDITPAQDPAAMEVLEASGKAHQASGMFVVGPNGIVRSSWDRLGKPTTGLNLKFRSYFQTAMQGTQNVYAAVSMATGKRALFFAAPLYGEISTGAPVIGATVARMGPEQIESVLNAWPGPALLLSPQEVTFAANRNEWVEYLAEAPTPEKLQAIRALKQFGKKFESNVPKILPFDIKREIVNFENKRYAVAKAPVQWNDPIGEWTLVLLGGLDELMPPALQAKIGAATGALVLAMSGMLLFWRRRLQRSEVKRRQAEAELNNYTRKLEAESSLKSRLAQISTELQRTGSPAEFTRIFLSHAAQLLGVEYGIFYVLNEENGRLSPLGGFGVTPGGLSEVAVGQGLVGLCARDAKPIVITSPAGEDIRIVWGLGGIPPKAIILQPIVQTGHLLGVIELAALRPFDEDKQAMLETLTPMVAMNLEIMLRNLSTLRQAEALQKQQTHLQETETWYRGIIESAPDGILVADEQGIILLANPKIENLFGYDPGEMLGKNIEVLVPPDARAHHAALRGNYMQSGGARPMGGQNKELHGIRRDGTEFPVEVALSKLAALGGHGVCVCVSVREIAQRRKTSSPAHTS